LSENRGRSVRHSTMKDFFKTILTTMIIVSAFLVGFHLGKTREKSKIPNFQEDIEENL
jgi:hypothetical protein